jgi:hypothetical protein
VAPCSSLRKTSHVLRALAGLVPDDAVRDGSPPITYYALDLEERELRRVLGELTVSDLGPALAGRVATKGMWGTYDGGLKFVQEGGLRGRDAPRALATLRARSVDSEAASAGASEMDGSGSGSAADTAPSTPDAAGLAAPMHLLFLGSSLGNFPRGEDAKFLRGLPLRAGSGDTLLLGLDHGRDSARIERAYDDAKGITARFIMNGLRGAGRALGDEKLFDEGKFEYFAQYNEELRASTGMRIRCVLALMGPQAATRRSTSPRSIRSSATRSLGASSRSPPASSLALKSPTRFAVPLLCPTVLH